MVLLSVFRRRVGGENNGEAASPPPQDVHEGQEAAQEGGGARNGRQPWENHVIVRAIRRMRIVGLRQALQPNISLPKRIFWIGVFFICIWFTIHMLWLAVNEYSMNPTSNTIHDDVPINRGPFPGVTVAGTNTFQTSGMDNALTMKRSPRYATQVGFTKEAVKTLLFTIDHFCEMVFSFASKFKFLDEHRSMSLKWHGFDKDGESFLRDDPNDPVMIENVLPYIQDNTINCSTILLACTWDGEEDDCDNLFVPVLTDIGVGCSFNRIPEKILRTSTGLMSLLHNKTRATDEENAAWKEWDMDVSLRDAVDKFQSPKKFPRTQSAAGIMKGISFLLLHDVIQNFSCPATSSSGFFVAVHSPFEEPQMLKNGVGTPALHEVFIQVKGELRIVDEELRTMAKERRKCYFQNEIKLEIFTKYTLANCQSECKAKVVAEKCQCQQLLMSTGKNETLCGPSKIDCVRNITRDLDRDGYNEMCGDLKCLPPCSDVKYTTSVSYLPYNVPSIFNFENPQNFKLNSLGPQSITSIVHVYQESTSLFVRRLTVLLLYTFIIGTIFGILGWTLEFTVESFFKVVDGLTLLVAALYRKIHALRFLTTEDQNGQSANPSVLNENRAGPSNVQREIVLQRDNDYDSSSEDEPTSPEDVTRPCDPMELAEFDGKSMEGMRKSLQKDLTKIVMKDVKILKDELNSQIEKNMEILRDELKETIREDLTRFKDDTIQDLKATNRELVLDLKSANEALVNKSSRELRDTHQAIMQSFKDEMSSMRQMLLSEFKSSHPANTQTLFTNPETQVETDENSDVKFGEDEPESCVSDSLETTHVQTIDGARSGLERFQRTSNLVVLFTRSTNPSSSKGNGNECILSHQSGSLDPTMPQESILEESSITGSVEEPHLPFRLTRFPQRPILSANLLDIEDESDDDFKETIVVPKNT